MKKHEKYIECGNLKNATHLEVSVYYGKEGISCFTGKTSPQGYYISVRPVTKRDGTISFNLSAGYRRLLFEAKRYSDKQYAKAIEISKSVESELIVAVMEEYLAA